MGVLSRIIPEGEGIIKINNHLKEYILKTDLPILKKALEDARVELEEAENDTDLRAREMMYDESGNLKGCFNEREAHDKVSGQQTEAESRLKEAQKKVQKLEEMIDLKEKSLKTAMTEAEEINELVNFIKDKPHFSSEYLSDDISQLTPQEIADTLLRVSQKVRDEISNQKIMREYVRILAETS